MFLYSGLLMVIYSSPQTCTVNSEYETLPILVTSVRNNDFDIETSVLTSSWLFALIMMSVPS